MGSIVPEFEHDVFVSYATVDDSPAKNGWVTAFVELLRERLSAAYGRRNPDRVWWDRSNIDEETSLTRQISEKVQKSACLVVILSRGYVASNWCRAELEAFIKTIDEQPEQDSRTYLIDIGNLLEVDRPPEFRDIRGRRFWVQPQTSESPEDRQTLAAPVPTPEHPEYRDFYLAIDDLAKDVYRRVKQLAIPRGGPPIVNPPVVLPPVIEVSVPSSPIFENYNWDSGDYPVTVLVSCKSEMDESRIRSFADKLATTVPVFNCSSNDILSAGHPAGHHEQFRFMFRYVKQEALVSEAEEFLKQSDSRFLIVISDALQDGVPQNRARKIRTLFSRPSEFYCGLIGLSQGSSTRVHDLDRVLDLTVLAESMFARELTRTADGLRLKAPPAKLIIATEPVLIRLVQTKEEMRKCLHLRHLIYNRMHYLGDDIARHPSELELDAYDVFSKEHGTGGIHFLAWSQTLGEVVGTARLIVPREFEFSDASSVLGDPPEQILFRQAEFIRQIVAESDSDDVLYQAITRRIFNRMPVLQAANLQDKSLLRGIGLAEISRVIVLPRYRGCGLGALLVRALVAAAIDLQKPNVVLECIPAHVPMYEKFGFRPIDGASGQDESLDQEAIAMILEQPGAYSRAHSVADNDLRMIRSDIPPNRSLADHGYLCLCTERGCWEAGHYELKDHPKKCPLKHLSSSIELNTSHKRAGVK